MSTSRRTRHRRTAWSEAGAYVSQSVPPDKARRIGDAVMAMILKLFQHSGGVLPKRTLMRSCRLRATLG